MMMPPTGRDYPMGNVDAPLTQWKKRATVYRDQEECEHVLDRLRRNTNAKNKQTAVRYYKQAQCVSADDPRLKPK
jgi:predicted kinase